MTLWLRRTHGLDTETMQTIAESADVDWDYQSIVYRSKGIGYADGDESDTEAIQDAAQDLIGYRPQSYEPPERDDIS